MSGLYRHRCTIERQTRTNVNGVLEPVWTTIATGVSCLYQERPGAIQATKAGQGVQYDGHVYFPPDTDVGPRGFQASELADRLTVSDPRRPTWIIVLLTETVTDTAGQGHHLTALVKRHPTSPTTTTTTTTSTTTSTTTTL